MTAGTERFLVTGANGCIGAWVIRQLLDEGAQPVALDVSDDDHRLRLLLSAQELARLTTVRVDITNLVALESTLDERAINRIIHLAALQVPFCRADPPLGAHVNVVGTVNILEAAARRQPDMGHVTFASSIAAYDDIEDPTAPASTVARPGTLYGVYKRATEDVAALYWRDRGLASVGLRPHTVYGPGRDQGVTSAPTMAMLAAALETPFAIPYGGSFQLQYAPDVAACFIAAARSDARSAAVHNLTGANVDMAGLISAIEAAAPVARGTITYSGEALPFPAQTDTTSLSRAIGTVPETPLAEGITETIDCFRRLRARGELSTSDLPTTP